MRRTVLRPALRPLRWVMKNGRLYEAATLDEIWLRQRPLPAQWWWGLEPPGTEVPAGGG